MVCGGSKPPPYDTHRGWIEIVGGDVPDAPFLRDERPVPYGVAARLDRAKPPSVREATGGRLRNSGVGEWRQPFSRRWQRWPAVCTRSEPPRPTAPPQGWIGRSLSLWERWHAERDGEGERQSEDTYALSVLAAARTALPKGEPNHAPFPIHPYGVAPRLHRE